MKNKIKIGVLTCVIGLSIGLIISAIINGNLWTEYQYFTPLLYVIIIAAAVNELQHMSRYQKLMNRFISIKQDRDILKNINEMLLRSVRDLKIQRDETQKLLDYQTSRNKALKRQLISAKANFAKYNKERSGSLLCMNNCSRFFTKGAKYKIIKTIGDRVFVIDDEFNDHELTFIFAKTNFKKVK